MAPTKKQKQILEALLFLIEKGEMPTVREVGALVGLRSSATVMKHLQALEEEGLISMSGKSRGIRLRAVPFVGPFAGPFAGIPLVGRIAAGRPIEAVPIEAAAPILSIDPRIFGSSPEGEGGGELMALRVSGDSMIEAGILDGDHVIIRRQPVVEEGEIAAVEIDGEVTLKRWHRRQDAASSSAADGEPEMDAVHLRAETVHLRAENACFAPIEITAADHKEVRVLGKYVGLVRGAT